MQHLAQGIELEDQAGPRQVDDKQGRVKHPKAHSGILRETSQTCVYLPSRCVRQGNSVVPWETKVGRTGLLQLPVGVVASLNSVMLFNIYGEYAQRIIKLIHYAFAFF